MKLSRRQGKILKLLIDSEEPLTSRDLASLLCVSNKTIQDELNNLKEEFEEYHLTLNIGQNGYYIVRDQKREYYYQHFTYAQNLFGFSDVDEDRIYDFLIFLLKYDETTFEEIAEDVYLSIPVLFKMRQQTDLLLKDFNLEIEAKRGIGLQIKGEMLDKMNLFAYCLIRTGSLGSFSEEIQCFVNKQFDIINTNLALKYGLDELKVQRIVYSLAYAKIRDFSYQSSFAAYQDLYVVLDELFGDEDNIKNLVHDLIASYDEEFIGAIASVPRLSRYELDNWLKDTIVKYKLAIDDMEPYAYMLYEAVKSTMFLHENRLYKLNTTKDLVRENSPVSYVCAHKLAEKLLVDYGVSLCEGEWCGFTHIFQQAFSIFNRVRHSLRLAVISSKSKSYGKTCATRIGYQYEAYINSVAILSKEEWELNFNDYDLGLTDYPLDVFTNAEKLTYNPLVLDELSMHALKYKILRFDLQLERVMSRCDEERCFSNITQEELLKMLEDSSSSVLFSFGMLAVCQFSESDDSYISFHTLKKACLIQHENVNKVCRLHLGRNDSLHLLGRPLRMVLQDTKFLTQMGKVSNGKEMKELVAKTINTLQEAIY